MSTSLFCWLTLLAGNVCQKFDVLATVERGDIISDLATKLDHSESYLSRAVGDFVEKEFVYTERDGRRKRVVPSDARAVEVYQDLVRPHSHIDFPELLTGKTLEVLYYFDQPRTVSEIATQSDNYRNTVNRVLRRLRDRSLVGTDDDRLNGDFDRLHEFARELAHHLHRQRLEAVSPNGTILWEDYDEFLAQTETEYEGETNAIAAPTMGGLDTFAYYYAEGTSTPDESWDPIAKGEAFQVDIMRRSEELARENKEAARTFYEERFGLHFEEMDGLYGVDIAKHNGGAAIMAPIFLDPNVGYTVGAVSGYHWPAYQDAYTDSDPQSGNEPENQTAPGKVRDGGWWVTVVDTMTNLGGSYWSNEMLHDQPVEPRLTGAEGAEMTEDGVQGDPNTPGSMDLFFGDYNWYRGDAGEDIVINYKSTHPLDFQGNVPDAYVCDLWSPQLGGIGRVHGTAIPPQQSSAGGVKFTLRNALAFPPELNSERDAVVFPEKYRFIPDWASEPLPHLNDN